MEHFQKICMDGSKIFRMAVFLAFGVVSAQSQVYSNLRLLRRCLAQRPKILAAHRYIFYGSVPAGVAADGKFLAVFIRLLVSV
jgi:hypothetical protein